MSVLVEDNGLVADRRFLLVREEQDTYEVMVSQSGSFTLSEIKQRFKSSKDTSQSNSKHMEALMLLKARKPLQMDDPLLELTEKDFQD